MGVKGTQLLLGGAKFNSSHQTNVVTPRSSATDSYKVPNPEPTRRVEKSHLQYAEFKSSRKTLLMAVAIIASYLLMGVISFSFIFENWTVVDSLYFSVVTFTTVGYGDLYPGVKYKDEPERTKSQKERSMIFCSFFSLLGIAIIGYALQILGQQFVQAQVKAMRKANSEQSGQMIAKENDYTFDPDDSEELKEEKMIKSFMLRQEREREQAQKNKEERRNKIIKILVPIMLLFLVGALLFGYLEDWPFIDSFYWCVITVASVGYGEYSPKKQESRGLAIIFIPLSVGIISQGLASIVNIFIEEEIKKENAKLMSRELTMEDLDNMNTDDDGDVSQLEFVEFMLKTMKKVDQAMLDGLHEQFKKMDADGSGSLQKSDLELLAKRKLAVKRKLALATYKAQVKKKASSPQPSVSDRVSPE